VPKKKAIMTPNIDEKLVITVCVIAGRRSAPPVKGTTNPTNTAYSIIRDTAIVALISLGSDIHVRPCISDIKIQLIKESIAVVTKATERGHGLPTNQSSQTQVDVITMITRAKAIMDFNAADIAGHPSLRRSRS
jgi:hypothetical protein